MNCDESATDDLSAWSTGELLALTVRLAEQAWHEYLAGMGLSPAGYRVLRALEPGPGYQGEPGPGYQAELGPGYQAELARRCRIGPQSLGRTLDRLQRDGMVTRHRGGPDRRQVQVRRTAAADEALARVAAARESGEPRLFDRLPDAERFRADLLTVIAAVSRRPVARAS